MRSNAFHGKMWMSHIHANGTHLALGSFDTKEEAAAAFDGAAGHHFKEGAKCNFDMEMEDAVSADEASREAIQTRQLIHERRAAHCAHQKTRNSRFRTWQGVFGSRGASRYGERKQLEAYQYILTQLPIWTRNFEKEKDLVAWRRTYRRSGETGNDSGQGMLGCSVGSGAPADWRQQLSL
jgi:hypothetical protein